MLARIQQSIAFTLALLAVVGLIAATLLNRPILALVVPVTAIAGYVIALGVEFWLLWRSYEHDDSFRPGFPELMAAWIGETFAAPRAFLWRQPFRSQRICDRASASESRRGVVLVHGFFCNRGLWNPWLARLSREQVPFVAVNLEPVFGEIDQYRDAIATAVERLTRTTSRAPIVVAHSMGGLAVRAWLATAEDASVHRVVTIASPHSGTRLARYSFAANVASMRIDSPWLKALWSRERASTRAKFVCFWSHCDNIVFPTRSATLPEADNRHLRATAHVEMALHPDVIDVVLQLVNEADAGEA